MRNRPVRMRARWTSATPETLTMQQPTRRLSKQLGACRRACQTDSPLAPIWRAAADQSSFNYTQVHPINYPGVGVSARTLRLPHFGCSVSFSSPFLLLVRLSACPRNKSTLTKPKSTLSASQLRFLRPFRPTRSQLVLGWLGPPVEAEKLSL